MNTTISEEARVALKMFLYRDSGEAHTMLEADWTRSGYISWLRANELEEAGLIEVTGRNNFRRVFRITAAGLEVLGGDQ